MTAPVDSISGISGLIRRWRADQIAQANGSAVASWPAAVGGVALAQATATAQPTYITSGINGQPVVRFDGTTDRLDATTSNVAQPVTVIAAVKLNNASANGMIYNAEGVELYAEGGKWIGWGGAALTGPSTTTSTATLVFVANGASSAIRVNGTAVTGNAGTTGHNAPVNVGDYSAGGYRLSGDVAEIAVFNRALTASEIATVESYFASRYLQAPVTPTVVNATVSGSGTLSATVTRAPAVRTGTITGSGAITATVTRGPAVRAAALAGSGALSATVTNAPAVRAVSLAGSGDLSATVTNAPAVRAAALGGAGALSATTTPRRSIAATLTGAGVLAATVTVAAPGSITGTLTGSGALTATVTRSPAVRDASLTGSGALSSETAYPGRTIAALIDVQGSLSATVTAGTGGPATVAAPITAVGTLAATVTPRASIAATITASGHLTSVLDIPEMTALWIAVEPIFFGNLLGSRFTRGFNPGERVPDSVVLAYWHDLIRQVISRNVYL